MDAESAGGDSIGPSWRGRRLLPATIAGTFALLLLGIYTAAIGAGLTCDARWPLCDGAVFGLFPANWPSFVEWFHRLVAMLVGFLILASSWVVWRDRPHSRVKWVFALAVVMLPVQIGLGAQTVLTYELVILTAHFVTGLLIFAAILLGGLWSLDWLYSPLLSGRNLLLTAALLFVPFVVTKPHFLLIHTGPIQILYNGLGLIMFSSLLVLTVRLIDRRQVVLASLGSVATMFMAVQLVAGRLVRSRVIHTIDWSATVLVLAVVVVLIALVVGRPELGHRSTHVASR